MSWGKRILRSLLLLAFLGSLLWAAISFSAQRLAEETEPESESASGVCRIRITYPVYEDVTKIEDLPEVQEAVNDITGGENRRGSGTGSGGHERDSGRLPAVAGKRRTVRSDAGARPGYRNLYRQGSDPAAGQLSSRESAAHIGDKNNWTGRNVEPGERRCRGGSAALPPFPAGG